MRKFFARYKFFGIIMSLLSVIIIYFIYNALKPVARLPIYQPATLNPELVDSTLHYTKKYHTIADFKLTNQNGETVTQKTYENKIYIADFFFTTCPSICPLMTKNMFAIQQAIQEDDSIMLLSHSVTPKIDSVPQLKKYAIENGVIDSKWNLVTGDKKQIYELARKSYFAVLNDGDGGEYDMIHTENFVLIDKEKRIRGTYDGTNNDEIKKLLKDLKILKNSYAE